MVAAALERFESDPAIVTTTTAGRHRAMVDCAREKGMNTTSAAKTPASRAPSRTADDYLTTLTRPEGPLAAHHVRLVCGFWQELRSSFRGAFPVPQASPTPDLGLLMLWDRDRHHLEVEIYEDGTYDWFYRDRETESYLGDEGLALDFRPPELLDHLRHFSN